MEGPAQRGFLLVGPRTLRARSCRLQLERATRRQPATRFLRWNSTGAYALNMRNSASTIHRWAPSMDSIIYLVGLIVIIMFILSALGLR